MNASAGAAPVVSSLGVRLGSKRTAVALGVIELALLALALTIASFDPSNPSGVAVIPLVFAFLGIGLLVAYKRPDHRLGWLLLGCSFFLLLTTLGGAYSILDYRIHHGRLPLGPVAVVIGPSWAPAIVPRSGASRRTSASASGPRSRA